ncbi:HTH_Tnp_Tc3_2 domain-containing protein [Trichonephila clavipes]|nr:HTH_Tnp_Tc3_2 domain-containing protein [Trichonephila clavipes]
MLKHLRLNISDLRETKLPIRLINTINERRLVKGHETTPPRVKRNIEDVSRELDNMGLRLNFLDETPIIILLSLFAQRKCWTTRTRLWQTIPLDDVTARRNRWSTASELSRQLSSATGTTVSRQTVYRRLGHVGLYARRPVRCVPLTATHCRLQLTWGREHSLWTPQQWSCEMFSDEFRFSLQSDCRRTLKWRAPGTRYRQENTI